jgi:hypothetical protein
MFEMWGNVVLADSDVNAGNTRDFSGTTGFMLGRVDGNRALGTMDDFRVYGRSLYEFEIAALSTP